MTNRTGNIPAMTLYRTSETDKAGRRMCSELIRWHLDKLVSKFGALVAGERERVLDKVKHISQMLTGLND
jgi:hypothetical protein